MTQIFEPFFPLLNDSLPLAATSTSDYPAFGLYGDGPEFHWDYYSDLAHWQDLHSVWLVSGSGFFSENRTQSFLFYRVRVP